VLAHEVSVWLDGCLSVTFVYYFKMAKDVAIVAMECE